MADVAHIDNSSKFVTGGDLGTNGIPNGVIFVVKLWNLEWLMWLTWTTAQSLLLEEI